MANILEFGVFQGASIRWLRAEFPKANIVGADILDPAPSWPRDARIRYVQLDQARRDRLRDMLRHSGSSFDLIIEDGSHIPQHQASCLTESFPYLRNGGLYILEDIHTSHPDHAFYREYCQGGQGVASLPATSLHVLLAMQHLKATGSSLTNKVLDDLSSPGFFSQDDVRALFESITSIELYRRTQLPLRCYRCGSTCYDYTKLTCECGVPLYENSDSMSFLIRKELRIRGASHPGISRLQTWLRQRC